jgi:hypothetical protein
LIIMAVFLFRISIVTHKCLLSMVIKPITGQDTVGLDGTKITYTNLDYLQRVFTGA